jgi:uncharacterized membrane protein YgcG
VHFVVNFNRKGHREHASHQSRNRKVAALISPSLISHFSKEKPNMLRNSLCLLLGVVAVVLMGTTSFAQLTPTRVLFEAATVRSAEGAETEGEEEGEKGVERRTFSLFNIERAKRNLPSLQWSDSLHQTARQSAQMQNRQQRVGHPLGGTEISASGNDPAQVVQMWLNSPGHRAILLSSQYTHAAVGNAGRYWSGRFSGGGASSWSGGAQGWSGRLTMDQIRELW